MSSPPTTSGDALLATLSAMPDGGGSGASARAAEALAAFHAAGDRRGALRALGVLASTLRAGAQFEALADCAREYVALAHELADEGVEAEALSYLATATQAQGHYGAALEALRQEVEVRARLGDRTSQAECLNNLGMLYANIGDHAEALGALFQCQQLVTQYEGIPADLHAACLVNIGHTLLGLRQYEQALDYLLPGLETAAASGDIETELSARSQLGLVWRTQGQHGRAAEVLERGLVIARAAQRTRDMVDLSDNLGQVMLDTGDVEGAERMFRESERLAALLDDVQGKVGALLSLGRLSARQGAWPQAVTQLGEALALAEEHDLRRWALDIHLALHEGYESQQDLTGAYRHHRAYAALERAIFNEDSERKTRTLTARFEAERARREAETYRQMGEVSQTARLQAEETVRLRTAELEAAQVEIVTRLGMAAEYRDDKTGQHTRRVGELSAHLAQVMGLAHEQVDLLRWAARLHDIGKIGVGDDVLLKQGPYTPEEFERMKIHTFIGAKVLEGGTSPLLKLAEEIALTHHERWDGQGYPRGLSGEEIPVSGRIVAVADVFDALTNDRHYKPAWSVSEALREMQQQSGKQFDPQVVVCLTQLVQTGNPAAGAPSESGSPLLDPVSAPVFGDQPPGEHAELQALINRAWDLRLSDPRLGEELAYQALDLAQNAGDDLLLGFAHRNVGRYQYHSSDYEGALTHLAAGLDVGLTTHNLNLQADCANLMAAVYNTLTDFGKATEQLSLVLRIAREQQDKQREAHCLHNLSLVSKDSREPEKAHAYLTESIATYRAIGDKQGEVRALGTYADFALDQGDFDLAARLATDSSEQATEIGNAYVAAIGDAVAGKAYARKEDFARALSHLLRALEFAESADNKQMRSTTLFNLGNVYRQLGRFSDARLAFDQALTAAQDLALKDVEMGVYRSLSEMSRAEGDLAGALDFYQRHHAVELEIFNQDAALKTRAMMVQLEVERAKSEAQIYKLRSIELASANAALERVNAEKSGLVSMLEEQSRLLERQLSEDGLTGLYNRKHIEGLLQREFLRHKQHGLPLCIAMVDIDHFKQINDQFSHLTGDQVLKTVARLFHQACRPTDAIGRYGGEEFLFVFPATSLEHGRKVCERIQAAMQTYSWEQVHPNLHVTLSVGLCAELDVSNHEKLISRADARLYEAKNSGRNRICG